MPVTIGAVVPTINLRIVQGDTFYQGFRRDHNGVPIDTSGYSARMMIRRAGGNREVVCDLVSGAPQDGKGFIELGVTGREPRPGQQDTRTNVRIIIPPELTATFPRSGMGNRLLYDLKMTDPAGVVRRWARGTVRVIAEQTYV